MKKNCVMLVIAGMLILTLMAGCSSESTGNGYSHTDTQTNNNIKKEDTENQMVLQEDEETQEDEGTQEDIEKVLADYRSDRKKGESDTPDGYVLAVAPNEEEYDFGVGDTSYTSRFDTKEVGQAFKAAEKYLEDTLQIESPLYCCVDPRMTAIYDDADKGVASGYDADNIFLCEYNDNGNWQYLILVREGKGSDWNVLYHGNSYKTD